MKTGWVIRNEDWEYYDEDTDWFSDIEDATVYDLKRHTNKVVNQTLSGDCFYEAVAMKVKWEPKKVVLA